MSSETAAKRPRIHTMDEIRGFCIICMVAHHAFFDLVYLFSMPSLTPVIHIMEAIRVPFALAFVVISGISSRLSRSNVLRGAKLLAVALGVTLVTGIFMPENIITFGILHALSLCMLIFTGIRPLLDKIRSVWGILLFSLLFFLFYNVSKGQIGIPDLLYVTLPIEIMRQNWLFIFGIPWDLGSADYFPLIPWVFAFIAGTYLGIYAKDDRFPQWMMKERVPFLRWIGSKTLIVYILHQPVVYGILYFIFVVLKIQPS